MSRSKWKGPFSEIKKLRNFKHKSSIFKQTKIWSRRSVILPDCLNKKFLVYNGKIFNPVTVSENMIGHKFGEFSATRKKPFHKTKRR